MDNCISIFTQRHFIRMRAGEGESLGAINSVDTEKKGGMLRGLLINELVFCRRALIEVSLVIVKTQ